MYDSLTSPALNTLPISIGYVGFVRERNDVGAQVVPGPQLTDATVASNTLTVTAAGLIDPIGTATVKIVQNPISVTKSGTGGTTPGILATWTIHVAVSDYFEYVFDDSGTADFQDQLQDGQTYETGTMTVTVSEDGTDIVMSEADLLTQGHMTITAHGDGTTDIALDLGDALADPFFGFADATLQGANFHGEILQIQRGLVHHLPVPRRRNLHDDGDDRRCPRPDSK